MRRVGGGVFQRINDFPILTRFSFGIPDGMQRDINLRKSVEKLGHLWAAHFMPAKQMCNLKTQERWRETNLKIKKDNYLHFAILTAGMRPCSLSRTLLGTKSGYQKMNTWTQLQRNHKFIARITMLLNSECTPKQERPGQQWVSECRRLLTQLASEESD